MNPLASHFQLLTLAGQQFTMCKIETAVGLPPELEEVGRVPCLVSVLSKCGCYFLPLNHKVQLRHSPSYDLRFWRTMES